MCVVRVARWPALSFASLKKKKKKKSTRSAIYHVPLHVTVCHQRSRQPLVPARRLPQPATAIIATQPFFSCLGQQTHPLARYLYFYFCFYTHSLSPIYTLYFVNWPLLDSLFANKQCLEVLVTIATLLFSLLKADSTKSVRILISCLPQRAANMKLLVRQNKIHSAAANVHL